MSLNIKYRLFIDLCQFNKFHIDWSQANQCKHCNVWQAIWQLIDSLPRIKTLSLTVKMAPINLHWPTLSRDQIRHNETGACIYREAPKGEKCIWWYHDTIQNRTSDHVEKLGPVLVPTHSQYPYPPLYFPSVKTCSFFIVFFYLGAPLTDRLHFRTTHVYCFSSYKKQWSKNSKNVMDIKNGSYCL